MDKVFSQKDEIVELLCQEGCQSVNKLLLSEQLQCSHDLLSSLNEEQRQLVIVELTSIMNVYSDSGSCTI